MGEFSLTLGTLLVGIFFNTYLFGLVTFQFAAYYRTKFNDPLALKCMVAFLFVLDAFHSVAVIWMAWQYCVTNYTNPESLAVALWPYTFTPIATGLASVLTQVFLGWRVYRFTNSRVLYAAIITLSLTACALGMACGIKAWMIKIASELKVLTKIVNAWLILQVFCDVFVTGSLGVILYRSRTGFSKTDTVLYRLIRGAIQTGLFAGIFSLGDLITFTCWPDTNMYGMFAIPIGRIYTNTLLDTLLARTELRQQLNGTVDVDSTRQAPSVFQWARSTTMNAPSLQQQKSEVQLSEISVQKEVVVLHDDGTRSMGDKKHIDSING